MANSAFWHLSKNLFLIALSLALLPLSTSLVLVVRLWQVIQPKHDDESTSPRKTVLVTGVNMAKGLTVARIFKRKHHRVIAADWHWLSLGSVSSAIDTYYAVPPPSDSSDTNLNDEYTERMLQIAKKEGVDLWISVSDVHAAVQDATVAEMMEADTKAKAIQFNVEWTCLLHNKDSFMDHSRNLGLRLPDTSTVRNQREVVQFLESRGGLERRSDARLYLIKYSGVDDQGRSRMPLLPLESKEATLRKIEQIPFDETPETSFIAQEFIAGEEYCTHALVIRGQVRAFVACPSGPVLLHYTALPPDSPISQAMQDFTQKQAAAGGENFTGHLSFDFMVRTPAASEKDDVEIYPIECNPRSHTAAVLFNHTPELVEEYLSVLSPSDASSDSQPLAPENPGQYYWVGQDLAEEVLDPLYRYVFAGTASFGELYESSLVFLRRVCYWNDGTFDSSDLFPWWWLYHVYWPMYFVTFLFRGQWRKLNISTGKIF
ncbi:hypothetical protein AK830_g2057 [Neonectria ditissima]|uniref:ATP-grasp domain-containing protein n=1 Tax=Neonectria ditissima TaxID=78410 RepID=A0A0P7B4K3_9HYPO|nr:hypothetical protein AK830_g2057 [Neonectria ditissima]